MTEKEQVDLTDGFTQMILRQNLTSGPVDTSEHSESEDEGTNKDAYLPERPEEPLQSDCCGSGCTPCVFDIYQNELEKWETLSAMTVQERAQWLKRQQQEAGKEAGEEEEEGGDTHSLLKALSPTECREFTVKEVEKLTSDTFIFTFFLPPGHILGLTLGQHVVLRVRGNNGEGIVSRQYTPISALNQQGSFSVLIKRYVGGKMSELIRKWGVGSTALWKGPFGGLPYSQNLYDRVGLLACGTGVAPIIQVIRTVVENNQENTFLHLVYSCRTQHDILLKRQLEQFTSHWNFTVLYVLTRSSEESVRDDPGFVKYGDRVHFGRVDETLVLREMPQPAAGRRSKVLICGTKSFDKDMINHLKRGGYSDDMYFKF